MSLLAGCTSTYFYLFSKPAHELASNADGHIPSHLPLIGNSHYALTIEGVNFNLRFNNYALIDSFDAGIDAVRLKKVFIPNKPLVVSIRISQPRDEAILKNTTGALLFPDGRRLFAQQREILNSTCLPGFEKEIVATISDQEIPIAVDTPEKRAQWSEKYAALPERSRPYNSTIRTCLQFEYNEAVSPTSEFQIDLGTLVLHGGKNISLRIKFYPAMYKTSSVG